MHKAIPYAEERTSIAIKIIHTYFTVYMYFGALTVAVFAAKCELKVSKHHTTFIEKR